MSINQILQPSRTPYDINGSQGTETLRSYQHASRIFVDGDYRLSPKYGFLFYVEFDFNPLISNISNTAAQELGMIVKSVNLPKFTVETKVHNAYNRKNIVQNSVKYDPVDLVFHDDQADNVRQFWYDYYSFFYRDSDYADATYQIIHKYQERPSFEWGYTPRPNGSYNSAVAYQSYHYIQAIRIYSLYQKNFSEYELINPIITSFRHGEHANGDNNLLEHSMTIQYEAVKYYTGYTTQNTAGGFIDLHYDSTPSPIAPAVGVNVIDNGQGGYTTATDVITDLANQNTLTAGGLVVAQPNGPIISAASSFSTALTNSISLGASATANNGGFALPSLGTLTTGFTTGSIIQQQLQSAAVGLAGTAATSLAGGVVKGVANGLGTSTGTLATIGAAVANPSAALATVENMATGYATGLVTGYVNNLVGKATQQLASGIGTSITNFASQTGITTAIGDLSNLAQGSLTTLEGALGNQSAQVASELGFTSVGQMNLATSIGGAP